MPEDSFAFTLLPGTEDPPFTDREYQAELRALGEALEAAGIDVASKQFMPRLQPGMIYMSLGRLLGEYAMPMAQVVVPAVTAALVAWITARGNRRVRIKIGSVEVDARTPEEVEQLLQRVKAFQEEAPGKNTEAE